MLYTFIVSISIPNCKSIAHFLSPKWGVLYLQKHTNYDVRFQSRFLLFLGSYAKTNGTTGFLRKNWSRCRRYRLCQFGATAFMLQYTATILSVQRPSLWCIVGRVVMHCGSQRMPRPARDRALQRLGGINGSPVPELAPLGTWKSDVLVAN